MTDRNNSGVRNLRAMFENSGAAPSPEPRGRSPAGSANDSNSRPASKVRASFVSVVPPHHHVVSDHPATKGISVNAPEAHRRESFSESRDLGEDGAAELKRVIGEEKEERSRSMAVVETIPEQAVETRESSLAPTPIRKPLSDDIMTDLGTTMQGSKGPGPKNEQLDTQAGAERTAPEKAVNAPAKDPDSIVSGAGAQQEVSLKSTNTTPGAPKATAGKAKTNGTSSTPGKKPAAISTAKASASRASSAQSPVPKPTATPKQPKTPAATATRPTPAISRARSPAPSKPGKAAAPKEVAKASSLAPRASRSSLRPSTATVGTTASAAAKAKAPVAENRKSAPSKPAASASRPISKDGTTTSPGGFKKPRPKSPTRPVRLPSHLTAPTASSAAKTGDEAAAQKLTRKPSTATRTAPKAAPPRNVPSRASLAPAPATKRPASRASTAGAPDESFLARMMRPTASSASKTNEHPAASPPRKTVLTKAPVKPRGPESVITKGKKKVEEVAAKAKEVVMNGHPEDKAAPAGPTKSEPVPFAPAETEVEKHVDTEAAATTPEPVPEESVPEPVEEPIQPAQSSVDGPAEEAIEEPNQAPVEEPFKEPIKEHVKEPVKEPVKEHVKEPVKDTAKEPVKDTAKEVITAPVEALVEENAKEVDQAPVGVPAQETAQTSVEETAAEAVKAPVEEPAKEVGGVPAEEAGEEANDTPTPESVVEKYIEKPITEPAVGSTIRVSPDASSVEKAESSSTEEL